MTLQLLLFYAVLAVTLARSVLVGSEHAPSTCSHCGLSRERRTLGEPICRCHA